MNEILLWCEKYRPRSINDCILPENIKKTFQQFVEKGEVPNLLLSGTAGTGKTTVARAMLEETNSDYILINGSMSGDMDTLRNEIATYASTVSFGGGRKYVILDEADHLTPKVMASLRGFIEEFSSNCSFILTCNFKDRIIEPLHSRCACIVFNYSKEEKNSLAVQFLKRVMGILDKEGITYDKKVVAELVKRYYPDGRRVINELQRYAAGGDIDSGILNHQGSSALKVLIPMMKNKEFSKVREWIGQNSDMNVSELYKSFYEHGNSYFIPSSLPLVVVTLAKYQFQDAFVADKEINLAACLIEIMSDAEFQ